MSWVFTIAIVIILLIAGFMLFFFMPKPTVFFDPYKSIADILEHFDDIKKEIVENQIEEVKDPVIPIYGFGEIKSTDYPKTYEILSAIDGIQTVGIINIKPKFQQVKEYGFAPVANNTVRHFFTIQESAGHKSGIWIDGERRFFTTKECIVGDMSREHSLFNKDKERWTTVLFIDITRSDDKGNSPNADIEKDEILKMFN